MISEDKAIEIIKLLLHEDTQSLGIKLLYDKLNDLNLLYQDGTIKNDPTRSKMDFSRTTLCLSNNFILSIDHSSYTTIDLNSNNRLVLRIEGNGSLFTYKKSNSSHKSYCLTQNRNVIVLRCDDTTHYMEFLKFLKTLD